MTGKSLRTTFLKEGLIIYVHDSLKVIFYINFKACLEEAVFPEELKITKVKPLFEKREKKMFEITV